MGNRRHQQIPALAPGKEKVHAEAATVFKVGGDVKRRNLMPGQQRATESGKEEHAVCFCVSAVAFGASETVTAHHSTEFWGHSCGEGRGRTAALLWRALAAVVLRGFSGSEHPSEHMPEEETHAMWEQKTPGHPQKETGGRDLTEKQKEEPEE